MGRRAPCPPAAMAMQYLRLGRVYSINERLMNNVFTHFGGDDESRRDELVRVIEHSVERLTLGELEALYYDLVSKDYIRK